MTQTATGMGIRGKASDLGREGTPMWKLFGLVELDATGTVLYTRFESDRATPLGGAPDYTGLNFFTEVAPFRNVTKFRNQLERFSQGSQLAQSMDFICEYEDGPLHVRVLLTRIREQSEVDMTKSILIHIRRAQ